MQNRQYAPRSYKTGMAENIFRSWCRSSKIPLTSPTVDGASLCVLTKDAKALNIVFSDIPKDLPDTVAIPVAAAASYNPNVSLPVFHQMTEAAGYGKPLPFSRGEYKKVYRNDFFLAAVRHREVRDAPDPPKEVVAALSPITKREIRFFFNKTRGLCGLLGFEQEDLQTFAMIWTITYIHRYWLRTETHKGGSDNKRLYGRFLRQRFGHLGHCMRRLHKPWVPDKAVVDATLESNDEDADHTVEPESNGSVKRRKSEAKQRLEAMLASADKPKTIERLQEILSGSVYDSATKRSAKQVLNRLTLGTQTEMRR